MSDSLKDRIIKSLIDSEKIRQSDLEEAMTLHKSQGVSFDRALIEKGLINEQDLLMLLVRELNIPFINLSKYKIDPLLKEIVPQRMARQYKIVPLSSLDDNLTIAVSDPLNVFLIDDLKSITGKEIDLVMSTQSEILKVIDSYYGSGSEESVTDISKDIDFEGFEIVSDQSGEEGMESSVEDGEKAPVIRMVNLIIREGIRQRASDIHIEPMADAMRVRYRIDGVLHDVHNLPRENQNAILVRIKIMSRMDITVNSTPQDGRFKLKIEKKEVDFRVSLLPTTFGQKVVMRILDKMNLAVGLEGLGFSSKALEQLNVASAAPFGMILVTGPTGSGKSTTLYSMLSKLNTVDRNIITVEDPVEYLIEGLTQIQARPEIGFTFAEGLKSILRQSPDIVMVGEIRDNETADIAIKASLTGQLVLSTLHTNDASGALTRLVDMGVEPFLVASSLVLVSAQRLCRKVCTQCKTELPIPEQYLVELKPFLPEGAVNLSAGSGCDLCRGSGYIGRMGLTEILMIDDDIRRQLLEGKSSDDIKEFARQRQGMVTLFEDAMRKCVAGHTTLEEVLRVTAQD